MNKMLSLLTVAVVVASGSLEAKHNGMKKHTIDSSKHYSHKKVAVYESELDYIKKHESANKSYVTHVADLKNRIAAIEEWEMVSKFTPDHISEVPALRDVLRMANQAKNYEELKTEIERAMNDLMVYKIAQ